MAHFLLKNQQFKAESFQLVQMIASKICWSNFVASFKIESLVKIWSNLLLPNLAIRPHTKSL